MKKFRLKYFFLAILSGFLVALSFPKINAFYLVWIAFLPIIYTSLRNSVRNSLVYGFIFGFSFYAISLFWMFPFLKYNTNIIQALIASCLLWIYLSLYFSLFHSFCGISNTSTTAVSSFISTFNTLDKQFLFNIYSF